MKIGVFQGHDARYSLPICRCSMPTRSISTNSTANIPALSLYNSMRRATVHLILIPLKGWVEGSQLVALRETFKQWVS